MITDISVKYCTANEKYDVWVNSEYRGKYYTLQEISKLIQRLDERE